MNEKDDGDYSNNIPLEIKTEEKIHFYGTYDYNLPTKIEFVLPTTEANINYLYLFQNLMISLILAKMSVTARVLMIVEICAKNVKDWNQRHSVGLRLMIRPYKIFINID